MTIPYFHVDAFTSETFAGNPAGVCLLERWPDDALMLAIARENNVSETAFLVPEAGGYRIRWFSPTVEIDLCGHATLASAHVLLGGTCAAADRVTFASMSGPLTVRRGEEGRLIMDFPSRPPAPIASPPDLAPLLGRGPVEVLAARDLIAVFETEDDIRSMAPDFDGIAALDWFALTITAPGGECDFVSRFFAPRAGIDEDPVTGSAHCSLTPYWAGRLGKTDLHARQLSARGGELFLGMRDDRVAIGGRAVTYLAGTITI